MFCAYANSVSLSFFPSLSPKAYWAPACQTSPTLDAADEWQINSRTPWSLGCWSKTHLERRHNWNSWKRMPTWTALTELEAGHPPLAVVAHLLWGLWLWQHSSFLRQLDLGKLVFPLQHRSPQIGVFGRTLIGQDPGTLEKLSTKLKRPLSSAAAAWVSSYRAQQKPQKHRKLGKIR